MTNDSSSPATPKILAVITGTSRGIGAGIAAAATADGALVASCNRTPADSSRHLKADLADPAAWPMFADWLDELLDDDRPDQLVFVHNAATLTPIGFAGEVDAAAYRHNVLLNSAAPQVLGDAVLRSAHRTGTPTVLVQLSSGAGKNPYPGWTSYCASKAAVDLWVRSAGLEQRQRGDLVRTFAISPGVVATDMQAEIRSSDVDAFPNVERFRGMFAEGQLGDPDEVGAVIWRGAVAPEAVWQNGAVLDLDDLR